MREYVICSYYLYDNQTNIDYIILMNTDLFMGDPFNKIFNLKNEITDTDSLNLFIDKSVEIITDACIYQNRFNKCVLVKNDGILRIVNNGITTHNDNYNGYDLIWDEEKSGINPFEFSNFVTWNVGSSSYSSLRTKDHVHNRDFVIRDNTLNLLLDEI